MTPRHALAMLRCYGPVDFARSCLRAVDYAIRTRALQQPIIRRRVFDFALDLDARDPGIAKELAIFAKRELEHRWILERVLQPGMVVWDLGANIGYYAIMEARLVGTTGFVYAVEPSPANAALLRRNIAMNGLADRITVEEVAISNHDGSAAFYLSERSNVHTLHATTYHGGTPAHLTGRTVTVRVVDVPTFLRGKRSVNLVRMDIEGHEVEVFEAIARAIREYNFRAAILFETHFPKYDDREHDMRMRLRTLFAMGYRPTIMASTDEQKARFRARGLTPECSVRTDGVVRGIYRNVHPDDALSFICDLGGVRTVLLERAG